MSNFDNTINDILQNIVFEQIKNSETDPDNIIKDTQNQIEIKKNNMEAYMAESKAKYDAGVNALLQKLSDLIKPYYDDLNKKDDNLEEDIDWKAAWNKTKEMGRSIADKLGPPLHSAGEAVSDTVGNILVKFVDKAYLDDIENNISESIWYKIVAVFEPSGVMSWPYYRNALDLYEKNKGTEDEDIYFLNLLAAQISVIPGVRMPLAILTAPFKLITNPIRNIFGNQTKRFAREMAKQTRSNVSKSQSLAKANSKLPKNKKTQTVKTAAKTVSAAAGKVAKPASIAAKTATVIGSGDIPGTWRKWTEDGDNAIKNLKTGPATLGRFPSFTQLSTQ
jgi:hypothetical protein